jgi:xylulokinase
MAERILVFDLGTTYFKISLFDSAGHAVAIRRVRTPIQSSAPGIAEIHTAEFQALLVQEVRLLSADVGGLDDVAAITFATQANTFLLLDADESPLTPLVVWSDERAADNFYSLVDDSNFAASVLTTGVPRTSHLAMPAKLRWIAGHAPATYNRTHKVLLLSDYLTWWFTGKYVTEAGTAALTGLVDIHRITWWLPALDHLGISQSWLPQIVRAGTDVGGIRPSIARDFGLPTNSRFVVGCLDQYAGAIGAGNVSSGCISETTGTVLATVSGSREFQIDLPSEVYQGPSFSPDLYYQMTFSALGAGLLERYREGYSPSPTYEELNRLALLFTEEVRATLRADALSRTGIEMFLPQYQQEPLGHHVRAIMNVVARELQQQVKTLIGSNQPDFVRSVGGAARSELWRQIKAKQLGTSVVQVDCPEPTSLGAAMLARHALTGISVNQIADEWVCLRT